MSRRKEGASSGSGGGGGEIGEKRELMWGQECRFKDWCKREGCAFNHSKRGLCREGGDCRRKGCWYNHPKIERKDTKKHNGGRGGNDRERNVQKKCKYGKLCQTKTICVYNHPGRPKCRRGDACWLRSCWYNHSMPICKFRNCTKKDSADGGCCPYRHPVRDHTDSEDDGDETCSTGSENEIEDLDWDSAWSTSDTSDDEDETKKEPEKDQKVMMIKKNKITDKKEAIGTHGGGRSQSSKSKRVEEKDANNESGKKTDGGINKPRQPHQIKKEELPVLRQKLEAFGFTEESNRLDLGEIRKELDSSCKMTNNEGEVSTSDHIMSNSTATSSNNMPRDVGTPSRNQQIMKKKRSAAQLQDSSSSKSSGREPQSPQMKSNFVGNAGHLRKATKVDAKNNEPIAQIRIPSLNLSDGGLLPTPESLLGEFPSVPPRYPPHYPEHSETD